MNAIIKGTGSALGAKLVKNADFLQHQFYDKTGKPLDKTNAEIIAKLEAITGIRERRYVSDDEDSVPLMASAATKALADAGIQANNLQGIIVAHNAGNMLPNGKGYHTIPNMAALLKNALRVQNYDCFAYDILFGCPGWLQGVVQAKQALADTPLQRSPRPKGVLRSGEEEGNILVVGIEVASRFVDPHDLDSMILADGCGACVVSKSRSRKQGILAYTTYSHAQEDLACITQGESKNPDLAGHSFFRMNGRDVYRYATTWVPRAIKQALDKAGKSLDDVDMFLFHQANGKMLNAIAHNLADIYGQKNYDFKGKIPTTIEFLGNTSVATIPTMLDLIRQNKLAGYQIKKGHLVVMASVGAGMHCNALVYQF